MKRFLFLTAAIIFASLTYAQTGPGGVGNATGANSQPQNVMWFAADSLNLSNGDPVSIWNDISGNGNDAEQSVSASQPTFTTGEINGLPAVVFDGTNDFMPFDGNQIANSDYTVIFVGKEEQTIVSVFLWAEQPPHPTETYIYIGQTAPNSELTTTVTTCKPTC